MDLETLKILASFPLDGVLIYLIIRQQGQIDRLLGELAKVHASNAANILSMMTQLRPCATFTNHMKEPEKN